MKRPQLCTGTLGHSLEALYGYCVIVGESSPQGPDYEGLDPEPTVKMLVFIC